MWWEFFIPFSNNSGCLESIIELIIWIVVIIFIISLIIAAWWVILIELAIAMIVGLILNATTSGSQEIAMIWGIVCLIATLYVWYRYPQFPEKAYGDWFSSRHTLAQVGIWIELFIESALTGVIGMKCAGFDFS